MKISIVTTVFNRAKYLSDAIESVVTQSGDFSIQYIIQDAKSTDGSLEIANEWKAKVNSSNFINKCNHIDFQVYSEEDDGMYHGLKKGLDRCTGEIMAWINSDDAYHPGAFQSVAQAFGNFNNIYWITGIPNSYNIHGAVGGIDDFPRCYARGYIASGFYDSKNIEYGFNWLQQESTFWHADLWNNSDKLRTDLQYASDFYLWKNFAAHCDLVKVYSLLGGFRVHPNQFTNDPNRYRSELDNNNAPPNGLKILNAMKKDSSKFLEAFLADTDDGAKKLEAIGLNRIDLIGRSLIWSYSNHRWEEVWMTIF